MSTGPRLALVFVVEDDPDDVMVMRKAMSALPLSVEVRFAADGVSALEELRQRTAAGSSGQEPDLILLDLNLPRMDGRRLARALKATPALSRLPLVVLTTSGAEEDVLALYDIGVNAYHVKPDTYTKLEALLGRILEYWLDAVHPAPRDRSPIHAR